MRLSKTATLAGLTVAAMAVAGVAAARPGVAVPAGFRPNSLTFISATDGDVLGTVPCASGRCLTVANTTDGAVSWTRMAAPATKLVGPDGGSGVSGIRFGDANDGWVFGPQLWATHDGGRRWHRVAVAGVPSTAGVVSLETADGEAYAAVLANSSPGRLWLLRSAVHSDSWSVVPGYPKGHVYGAQLTVHGSVGWLGVTTSGGSIGQLYTGGRSGAWARLPVPCLRPLGLTSVAALSTTSVSLLCSGNGAAGSTSKRIHLSTDGGRHWTTGGTPPRGGDGGSLAEPSPGRLLIATASAGSWIYYSGDSGNTWSTVLSNTSRGGEPWNDFGFTTPTQGVVILGEARYGPSSMYITHDGGKTWSVVHF